VTRVAILAVEQGALTLRQLLQRQLKLIQIPALMALLVT
jgi:hypothetical protein